MRITNKSQEKVIDDLRTSSLLGLLAVSLLAVETNFLQVDTLPHISHVMKRLDGFKDESL